MRFHQVYFYILAITSEGIQHAGPNKLACDNAEFHECPRQETDDAGNPLFNDDHSPRWVADIRDLPNPDFCGTTFQQFADIEEPLMTIVCHCRSLPSVEAQERIDHATEVILAPPTKEPTPNPTMPTPKPTPSPTLKGYGSLSCNYLQITHNLVPTETTSECSASISATDRGYCLCGGDFKRDLKAGSTCKAICEKEEESPQCVGWVNTEGGSFDGNIEYHQSLSCDVSITSAWRSGYCECVGGVRAAKRNSCHPGTANCGSNWKCKDVCADPENNEFMPFTMKTRILVDAVEEAGGFLDSVPPAFPELIKLPDSADSVARPLTNDILEYVISTCPQHMENSAWIEGMDIGDHSCNLVCERASASILGDPHVVNMRGEHFDILTIGNVKLLHYPKDSILPNLLIEAHIVRVGDCEQTFIDSLTMTGDWLASEECRLGSRRFKTALHDATISSSTCLDAWQPISNATIRLPQSCSVYVSMGTHRRWHFLEMSLVGFRGLSFPVGGVLGIDQHVQEMSPNACPGVNLKTGQKIRALSSVMMS